MSALLKSPVRVEAAHDILKQRRQPLGVFFAPKNVALIGATETEHSVGRALTVTS